MPMKPKPRPKNNRFDMSVAKEKAKRKLRRQKIRRMDEEKVKTLIDLQEGKAV